MEVLVLHAKEHELRSCKWNTVADLNMEWHIQVPILKRPLWSLCGGWVRKTQGGPPVGRLLKSGSHLNQKWQCHETGLLQSCGENPMAGCPGKLVVKHDCFPNAKGCYNYDHAIKLWFGGPWYKLGPLITYPGNGNKIRTCGPNQYKWYLCLTRGF